MVTVNKNIDYCHPVLMAAHFDDTGNTPRHRFDPTDQADIPEPDRKFGGVVSETVSVTCEFWENWLGLAEFVPDENWSRDKIDRLKRSIYFTHLPNYVSFCKSRRDCLANCSISLQKRRSKEFSDILAKWKPLRSTNIKSRPGHSVLFDLKTSCRPMTQ